MNYTEAVNYIENNTWSTTRLGLERTKELLDRLGNPQQRLKFIHVAGSNGKGSTCAMVSSIMQSSGYKTGLYVSPHLEDFRERFSVDGKYISEEQFTKITEIVKEQAEGMEDHPSQFEISTAMAMLFFLEENCDVVILEVGMGGALDSTNVIENTEVAVIMNIGLEHTEYLGDTLTKIAETKAGIIKQNCDVVYYPNVPEVEEAVKEKCHKMHVNYKRADFGSIEHISQNLDGQCFSWREMKEIELPLLGRHQEFNAVMAIETVLLAKNRGWNITEESIRKGIKRTVWHARMEILNRDPLYILDGGHNPQCAKALADSLPDILKGKKVTFIMGVLKDKDYIDVIKCMIPFAERFVCVTPNSDRALPAEKLKETIDQMMAVDTVAFDSVKEAVKYTLSQKYKYVVCFGSLYLAGIFRPIFYSELKKTQRKKGIDARNKQLDTEKLERSNRICEILINTEEYKKADVIMAYNAVNSEVDLSLLFEKASRDGKKIAFPKCKTERRMEALIPNQKTSFIKGKYGILEPNPEDSKHVKEDEIDLVLCPGTAVDQYGTRIGMGGGYYDVFLPKCINAKKICVVYEVQKITDAVKEETDYPMDAYVTEKEIKYL